MATARRGGETGGNGSRHRPAGRRPTRRTDQTVRAAIRYHRRILGRSGSGCVGEDCAGAGGGIVPALVDAVPRYFASLEPSLILPEVKDPKNWRGGELEFLDKDRRLMVM